MNKVRTVINLFFLSSKPTKFEWFLVTLILLLPFLSYFYGDTYSIIHYEMHFAGSIAEGGGILNYYEYVREMVESTGINGGGNYATYDFLLYIILGIWGIPLWIFYGSKGLSVSSSFGAIVYGKSILLIALFVASYLIYKPCQNLDIDNTMQNGLLFCLPLLFLCYLPLE